MELTIQLRQASDRDSVGWVGVDAGSPQVVGQITYAVWRGDLKSIIGGRFQGANQADFSEAVDLYTGRSRAWNGLCRHCSNSTCEPLHSSQRYD